MGNITNKTNYYTIEDIYNDVYNRRLSKTTIHKLCRNGTIPSVRLVRKFLIPAWWVSEQLKAAQAPQPQEA